jgi:hypothetical protein
MGFSLLRWKKSGRDWSRGEPPPRGSVEYCGVPEVFQPAPRAASSAGAKSPPTPPAPAPAKPLEPSPRASSTPPANPPKPEGRPGLAWLLGAAGVTYLGARWLEYRARPPESDGEEDGAEGDVVVLHPGDQVVVGGDGEGEEEYDPEHERDERSGE